MQNFLIATLQLLVLVFLLVFLPSFLLSPIPDLFPSLQRGASSYEKWPTPPLPLPLSHPLKHTRAELSYRVTLRARSELRHTEAGGSDVARAVCDKGWGEQSMTEGTYTYSKRKGICNNSFEQKAAFSIKCIEYIQRLRQVSHLLTSFVSTVHPCASVSTGFASRSTFTTVLAKI